MFGNPLISNTPVDDMYSSQADVYGNSFGNPMNYANQNQGWGVDPSLLSPSYTAPFRPRYGGPYGANEFGHPGFFRGMWNLSPFSRELNWGNPVMHQQASIDDVTNRPADAGMWAFQRIAMPIAGFGMANAALGTLGVGWKTGAKFGSGLGGGFASAFGANSGGIRATTASIRAAYASEGLSGAFGAIRGIGAGGAINLGARAAMGGAFGLAAGVALPIALGQALITGGEKGITDPYINTRLEARNLRDNFAGVTFADSEGNAVTGKGLSFGESTNMAKQITNAGIEDMSFATDEYRLGADMIGRTGLLDNANSGQIVERIKENMKQVKLIMDIANMPEIKDAVEQLAKLQMAGASTSGGLFSTASTTMGNIGRYAAMAGTSVQRMMNTVGMQGQYLYQANGMTPYLGQLAAGASYSSLAAAQRMGLISPEQMARMGGLDGATQASLTGQINASQTLYNKMALYNSFLGGQGGTSAGYGRNQSGIDVIQKFGTSMAVNPLGTYGSLKLYGRQMAGKQLEDRGSLAIEDEVISRAKSFTPWVLHNGKMRAEDSVAYLEQMGMNEDQIQAYLTQRMAETDQGTYDLRKRALSANSAERIRQYISDTGTYGGVIGKGIYNIRKAGRSLTKSAKGLFVDPVLSVTSSLGDMNQNLIDWAWFGGSVENKSDNIDDILGTKRSQNQNKIFNPNFNEDIDFFGVSGDKLAKRKAQTVANDINQLIINKSSGADMARQYMNAKDVGERQKYLEALIKSGHLKSGWTVDYEKDFANGDDFIKLDDILSKRKTLNIKGKSNDEAGLAFKNELEKVSGLQVPDRFDTLQDIGNAVALATDKNLTVGTAEEAMKDNEALKRFAHRHRITSGAKALEEARKVAIRARASGVDTFATVASQLNAKDFNSHDDAVRSAYEIAGGAHINAMPHAKDLTEDEALGMSAEVRQDALQKLKLEQLNKEGRIDFTTMRQAMTQIDNGKAVRDFEKAVDKFARAVDKDDKTGKPKTTAVDHNAPLMRLWDKMTGNQRTTGGN